MKTLDDVIETLKGRRGRLTIFCGAGISARSGIPTVSVLLEYILTSLGIESDDVVRLKNDEGHWRMPFEAFVDAFVEHNQDLTLFDIFLLGEPNQNHLLIKKLVLDGHVVEVCTTNFDLLIERALDAVPRVRFAVLLESGTSESPNGTEDGLPILKLHGTADDKSTIRSTISSIASGKGFEARKQLLRRVLGSSADVLWVWGYSCSDVLDINPVLGELLPNHQTVILLQHDPSIIEIEKAIVRPLSALAIENPFHKSSGCLIQVCADALVEALLADQSRGDTRLTPDDWQNPVHRWMASFASVRIKYSVLCHLFYNVAEYEVALKYNAKAVSAEASEDERGIGAALSNRGMILHKIGRNDEALIAFEGALRVFAAIDYPLGVATSFNNLGYVHGQAGKMTLGHHYIRLGLTYLDGKTFKEGRVCRGYLSKSQGELHVLEGHFSAAAESYEVALAMFRDGNVAEESEVLMLKGKMYQAAGRMPEADALLRRAMALAKLVGYADVAKHAARLLGEEPP